MRFMEGTSECSNHAGFDFLPPPLYDPSSTEAPQSVYSLGTTLALFDAEGNASITIRVKKHLHVRNARRSQIVLAEVEKSSIACCPIDLKVVAKFFDPLFVSVDELPSDDAPAMFRRIVA
ncbi:hypothetical protein V1507DRAFT_446046 [Lipomyces tetrasporus]